MRSAPPCLSILVLTEDSAADGCETIIILAKKMMLLANEHARTHRIALEPQGLDAKRAMRGNLWKSTSSFDRPKIVLLGRIIAAKLLEKDCPGFVFFHVDGDCAWTQRSKSENVAKFEGFVRDYVRQSLDNTLRRQRSDRGEPLDEGTLQREVEAALGRMLRLTPFYSVEAWLYQNTNEGRKLCEAHCGKHIDQIQDRERDRGQLDEVIKPKSKEFSCLEAKHNSALAEKSFPAEAAFNAGKSFADAVMAMLNNKELIDALASTYA